MDTTKQRVYVHVDVARSFNNANSNTKIMKQGYKELIGKHLN